MTRPADRRICIVQPNRCSPSETFIQAHADMLPARVTVVHGAVPTVGDRPVKSQKFAARAWRKAIRVARRQGWDQELTSSYLKVFHRQRPDAVLAEYGGTGVAVMEACRRSGIPLIVHFHGYDASVHDLLEQMAAPYRELFRNASAVIAVSRAMERKLIALGAAKEKVFWNPYGVDCERFGGADPAAAPPVFLVVGRFYEKKAPHLTLLAFAEVYRACPEARLRMIGFGPLEGICLDMIRGLGIDQAVTMLGQCPPFVVQDEMRRARCFVQHSKVAASGDSEGTPVAIIEAGASGLPVVSTRHAGIPDVVIEGETGYLVEELDVPGMAAHMLRLAREPALAGQLGREARRWIGEEFSMPKRIGRLWNIIESCMTAGETAPPRLVPKECAIT